jgi:hypothetical protein
MAVLTDMLRTARQDGPATLLAGGEAGVGKTRLHKDFSLTNHAGSAPAPVWNWWADGLQLAARTRVLRLLELPFDLLL